MRAPFPYSDESDKMAAVAARWLAKRDRGLSAAEQDAFFQWLSDDPRHRAAFAKEEQTWAALDTLSKWEPVHSARPNPDLLAPVQSSWRRRGRVVAALAGLAVAAAIAVMIVSPKPPPPEAKPVVHGLRVIPRPERLTLADGSIAELNHGGKFEVAFTATERRVRLVTGELHFTVAQNSARPFIVEVDGIAVRAVGTVFNVRRERDAIDVLVTEGRVQLEILAVNGPRTETVPVPVASGERARIDTASADPKPLVRAVSAAEIERELSWQGVRLEFDALPLAAVVTEFNLRNSRQLAIDDPVAGELRVAGTFRADQVEAFAHLLEASFGLVVERRVEGPWLIRRAE